MARVTSIIKPFLPILSAVYGLALIYITALPTANSEGTLANEAAGWLLSLAAIMLTAFVAIPLERKVYPGARQFSLKPPALPVAGGLLLMAPLWLMTQEVVVYGLASLVQPVTTEPLVYSSDELCNDLLSSVHAIFLAPILEELCYRGLAISPFGRRRTQIIVCVIMALLFGVLHVRNFMGASLAALFFGLVFIWSKNIWYAILLHAGSNLTATLLAVYSFLGIGEVRMCKTPVIFLPDMKVFIACLLLAIAGAVLIKGYSKRQPVRCGWNNQSEVDKTHEH